MFCALRWPMAMRLMDRCGGVVRAGVSVNRGGVLRKHGRVHGSDAYNYRLWTEDPLTGTPAPAASA
jgi:hypothetical protein